MSQVQENIKQNGNHLSGEAHEFVVRGLDTQEFEVLPLAGDASSRRYYRIVAGGKTSVLMDWEPFQNISEFPFLSVQQHFKKHSVRVPEVLACSPEMGLVLLEDLGDLTLERKFWENQDQKMVLPYYKKAIDELIKIHYPATFDRSDCTAFSIAFDTEKLLWEMNYGRKHLIEQLADVTLTPAESEVLTEIFTDICTKLDFEDKYICHRDYHSRNLMIQFGQMRVIDFQDARMGPIQYDLVSLVHDSYVNLNEDSINAIVDYYIKEAKNHRKSPIDRNTFYPVFRLQMLQRCFKACGSFASFYNMRSDKRYLKYLKPTLKKLAKALVDFPEYLPFLDILVDKGIVDKDYEAY
ncbi:MAG: phosphotransferase [Pseudobdellovibrionaceae bacterium]|nr:phosphotransferase [Bdellovibrionales bacterium]USN46682.1 MAG: phosphotransferase [Pseudobdellovibrionaceae bacterium]